MHLSSVPSLAPKTEPIGSLRNRTDKGFSFGYRYWKKWESVNRLIGSVRTEPTEFPPLMYNIENPILFRILSHVTYMRHKTYMCHRHFEFIIYKKLSIQRVSTTILLKFVSFLVLDVSNDYDRLVRSQLYPSRGIDIFIIFGIDIFIIFFSEEIFSQFRYLRRYKSDNCILPHSHYLLLSLIIWSTHFPYMRSNFQFKIVPHSMIEIMPQVI